MALFSTRLGLVAFFLLIAVQAQRAPPGVPPQHYQVLCNIFFFGQLLNSILGNPAAAVSTSAGPARPRRPPAADARATPSPGAAPGPRSTCPPASASPTAGSRTTRANATSTDAATSSDATTTSTNAASSPPWTTRTTFKHRQYRARKRVPNLTNLV
jgi:hypothetical protein